MPSAFRPRCRFWSTWKIVSRMSEENVVHGTPKMRQTCCDDWRRMRPMAWFAGRGTKIEDFIRPDNLSKIFRPFYLNERKVNDYFVQYFGDLTSFGNKDATALKDALEGSIKAGLPQLLGGLDAQLKGTVAAERSRESTFGYSVGTLTRFIVLRKFWALTNRFHPISVAPELPAHALIESTGGFQFHESFDTPGDSSSMSPAQVAIVIKQKHFEEKHEKSDHFVLSFSTPRPTVSIVSRQHITDMAFRHIRFDSTAQDAYFVGATIGADGGVTFLDPIAAGALVKP